MNMSGSSILKTTAAIVGMSALGALGSGTALAATPNAPGAASSSHGTVNEADLPRPSAASNGDQLHSFAIPKMATPAATPTTRYDDNNSNDSGYNDNSDYSRSGSSRYDNNYGNSDENGYYNTGDRPYRNNDNGLLGGGLLGGNN